MSISNLEVVVADACRTTRHCFQSLAAHSFSPGTLTFVDDTPGLSRKLEEGGCVYFLAPDLPGGDAMAALAAARMKGNRAPVVIIAAEGAMPPRDRLRVLAVYDAIEKPVTAAVIGPALKNLQRLAAVTSALVVDDSPGVRMVIRKVLANSMFRLAVEEVADGEAAISHCRARPCDIVFLDCSLRGDDSRAVVPRLLGSHPDAKVIMMADERDGDRADRVASSGAKAALRKPFYPADIDRALHAVFGLQMPQLATDKPRITVEI